MLSAYRRYHYSLRLNICRDTFRSIHGKSYQVTLTLKYEILNSLINNANNSNRHKDRSTHGDTQKIYRDLNGVVLQEMNLKKRNKMLGV